MDTNKEIDIANAQPGGIFRRLAAHIVDTIITLAIMGTYFNLSSNNFVDTVSFDRNPFGTMIATLLYYAYFVVFYHHYGATPGKMLFRLKILNSKTGEFLSYSRAFFRELISPILGIGYVLVLFRSDRRALLDLVCRSKVVKA